MRVATLGSGSRGNSVYVEAGETRLLVDAGFSGTQIARRLEALEVGPESIEAVVVTHEHRDHTSGVGVAARRWGWPVYLSPEVRSECESLFRGEEDLRHFDGGDSFVVGDVTVQSFLTSHDATAPIAVALVDRRSGLKLGVATDLGRPTTSVFHALADSNFLILEANHDDLLLRDGPYPWSIKERIGGSRGHLSNRHASELATELYHAELGGVLLAHLSRQCNEPELARGAVREALDRCGFRGVLEVARQDRPSRLFDVRRLVSGLRPDGQLRLFEGPVGA